MRGDKEWQGGRKEMEGLWHFGWEFYRRGGNVSFVLMLDSLSSMSSASVAFEKNGKKKKCEISAAWVWLIDNLGPTI